jgi:hypothetical protein
MFMDISPQRTDANEVSPHPQSPTNTEGEEVGAAILPPRPDQLGKYMHLLLCLYGTVYCLYLRAPM